MGVKLLYSGFENVSSLVVHPAHASAVRAQSGAKHISGRILRRFEIGERSQCVFLGVLTKRVWVWCLRGPGLARLARLGRGNLARVL